MTVECPRCGEMVDTDEHTMCPECGEILEAAVCRAAMRACKGE